MSTSADHRPPVGTVLSYPYALRQPGAQISRNALSRSCILIFLLLVSSCAIGQAIPQFSTVEPHQYDSINLATLGIQLNVPVRAKAGHVPFSMSLVGSVQVTILRGQFEAIPNLSAQESHLGQQVGFTTATTCTSPPGTRYSGFYFTDSVGNQHSFLGITIGYPASCGPLSLSGYASDGSGLYMTASSNSGNPIETVTDQSGNVLSGTPGEIKTFTDPNGNAISRTGIGPGVYTDSLDQTAMTVTGNKGSAQTATWTDALGNNQTVSLAVTPYTLYTAFGCADDSPPFTGLSFPTSVSFPDGSSMSITWEKNYSVGTDITGRLGSITVPNGGVITYTYSGGTHGINCTDGTPATMKRTTPDGQWVYTHVYSATTPTTTVQDPKGNNTVYTFSGGLYNYEVERQVYTGAVSPANLNKTVITCYNNPSSSPTNCNSTYAPQVSEKDEYTSYPGVTGYSAVKTQYTAGGLTGGSGLITDVKTYDFNATTPTNEKKIVYGTGTPTSQTCTAIGSYIVAKPCSITLYDSQHSNAILTQTWNSYDAKGNLLQTWDLVSGSGATGTYLSKQYTYDSHGVVQTATDVNGQVMNYTTTSCNAMFVTSQYPTNFTNLTTSQVWDCNGGVVTSSTDANGQIKQDVFSVGTTADPLYRPLENIDQLGNVTTLSYEYTASKQSTVDRQLLFNGNSSVVETLSTTDSLGRAVISQVRQGPASTNWDTKSRTFDADGRAFETSLACVATASTACSASTESQTYDGLNRPLVHIGTGGDVITKSYPDNDVLTILTPAPTNENAKSVQKEYDGLGRLKSTCVISSATGSGPCGQAHAGTGFLTTYSYDAAGRLLQTVENAQVSSPRQTRTYTYDNLGRVTSESNPESGTVHYVYDTESSCGPNGSYGSNGDLLQKTDAASVTICYYYDTLHRLTDVGNNEQSATNFCKRYRFDSVSNGIVTQPSGSSILNGEGRLVEIETDNCTLPITPTTDEWFSYSPRGELTDVWELTPHSGGSYYHLSASYWPHGTLETVTGVNLPTLTYGSLDGEGRVQTVSASSGANPVTAVSYNNSNNAEPVGALLSVTLGAGDTQSYTYDPNTGRMKSYSASVGATPTVITGTLNWNANGTLQQLSISDGYNAADTQVCSYLYDDFLRVAGTTGSSPIPGVNCVNGSTNVWNQTFTYGSDAFGNLTKSTTGPGLAWNPGYNSSNNQYSLAGTSYDSNGNLLADTFHTYTWQADGHLASIATGATTSSVTYDAHGNKVEEDIGGTILEYVYGFGINAQMQGVAEKAVSVNLPGGVQALYQGGSVDRFRFPDWQGTIRAEENPATRAFTESVAFAPFGERYAVKGAPFNVDSFTGKPDQLVSDEYDFLERQEHNGQGRWVSPDPMRGTGNKYVYADNNPLSKVDVYGLSPETQPMDPGFQAWFEAEENAGDPALESRGPGASQTGSGAFGVQENEYLSNVDVANQARESDVSTEDPAKRQAKEAAAEQDNGQPAQETQNQSGEQTPSGQNPPEQKTPSSWKPGQPLPNDPSGLGPDWHKNPDHKNPNGEQWVNDKTGEKVEFERGRPTADGWRGEDHWHYTPPGGDKGKEHIRPGEVGKLLVTAGQGAVQTIRDHPVATGVVVGTVALGATILTGGAAGPALALALTF